MGWRFFRRMKILPGVTLNLSRSGPSISLGPRGLKTTIGPRGEQTTVGLPGTGLSYTQRHGGQSGRGCGCWGPLLLLVLLAGAWLLWRDRAAFPAPQPAAPPPPPAPTAKASERLRAEDLVASLAAKDARAWRVFVTPAFRALPRETQAVHAAALWAECFGAAPGEGVLLLVDNDSGKAWASFSYRDGAPAWREGASRRRP